MVNQDVIVPLPHCACCGEQLGYVAGTVVAHEDAGLVVQIEHDCQGRHEHGPVVWTEAEVESLLWLL